MAVKYIPFHVLMSAAECRTSAVPPSLEEVCSDIKEFTDFYTFFSEYSIYLLQILTGKIGFTFLIEKHYLTSPHNVTSW